jgi:tetratricopeptide (TPR) repeat protein
MKYSLFALAGALILTTLTVSAQTDVRITKKGLRNNNTGFESAWQFVVDGNSFFKKGGTAYGDAYDNFLKATFYNGVNPELNYKTGVSALLSDNRENALPFFQKVLEENPELTDDLMYFTGRALQYAGRYEEAAAKLEAYLNSTAKKDRIMVAAATKYYDRYGKGSYRQCGIRDKFGCR